MTKAYTPYRWDWRCCGGEFQVNYSITSATFISVAPLMVIFLFLQRYFLAGLTVGAVKG